MTGLGWGDRAGSNACEEGGRGDELSLLWRRCDLNRVGVVVVRGIC
jgi:hypothetical protein